MKLFVAAAVGAVAAAATEALIDKWTGVDAGPEPKEAP